MQDNAADRVAQIGRGKQQFRPLPIGVILSRNIKRLQAVGKMPRGLVSGKNALRARDKLLCNVLECVGSQVSVSCLLDKLTVTIPCLSRRCINPDSGQQDNV